MVDMSIDMGNLSPWARRQIEAQLGPGAGEKPRKYHNKPTERVTPAGNAIRFDSRKEARRYDELMILLRAGKIRDLKLQPQFTLQESYITPEGERVRSTRYQADFFYERPTEPDINGQVYWMPVVEDVKSSATKTRLYQDKKKRMLEKFGISIHEV